MSATASAPTDLPDRSTAEASATDPVLHSAEMAARRHDGLRFPSLLQRAVACQTGSALFALSVLATAAAVGHPTGIGTGWFPLATGLAISTAIVLLGALASRRVLRPVVGVETQLHRLLSSAIVAPNNITPLAGFTAFEAGWNRLVEDVRAADRANSLKRRLESAVSEYRLRHGSEILNALTDGIAVTNGNQRITYANNALHSILHWDPEKESLEGNSIEEALARQAGLDPGKGIIEPGHLRHRAVAEIAFSLHDSNCTLRICRTPLAPDGQASQGGFVWSVRDVTQQKLADQMRDQFVNAATHELRTPMANIKAYAETLALGEVDDVEQQKMFCNVINDEVTRLARFIDDLLHLSRMEAGATTLQLQVTDMGRLLEETAKKVQPQMLQKKLRFDVDLPGKLPELIVDKDKLAVAVINLLGNAVKYTPEGGSVRMRVSLPRNWLQIDVEDTGIGIAEEELPKVLDKFYRSSDPRVRGEIGTGLGLSLAQEIIRLHSGKLSVSSQLNKGSKFTISLPMTVE